jgi:hypothetical protein
MAGGALRDQLRIDLRQGKARPRSLARPAHDGDDTVYLQSDAQLGGTLRKPRALASRSDLLARPLTLGCGSYGCGQKDEEYTEGVEILRLAHHRSRADWNLGQSLHIQRGSNGPELRTPKDGNTMSTVSIGDTVLNAARAGTMTLIGT